MKRFILFFLFFFLSAGVANAIDMIPVAHSIEEIIRFESQITINQDTSLNIEETINYFTPVAKHGIYRYIPEKYRRNSFIESKKVSDISVTYMNGKSAPFQIIRENGNVSIKIGDPNETFVGARVYKIFYKVERAVLPQAGFDELYWDITGEGWQFPIRSAIATVSSPHAKTTEVECFTGPVGGTEQNCEANMYGNVLAYTEKVINYGDNFTVAIKLDPQNSLIFPTKIDNVLIFLRSNGVFSLLFLPGLLMFWAWYKKGRDFRFISQNVYDLDPKKPNGLRPLFEPINIPMVYEPLKDLTPGEAGAMPDETVNNQDVIAEIVDLARKKYLKIERIEKKGFLQLETIISLPN